MPSLPIIIAYPSQKASVHKVDNVPNASNTGEAFVVSGDDVWLPGIFDSPAAAIAFATLLTPDEQADLWSETRGEADAQTPEEDPILDIEDVAAVLNARVRNA